jgi:hypothetical protein
MAKLVITVDVITDPANLDPIVAFDPVEVADAIERHVTTPLHDGYGFAYVIEHGIKDDAGTQVGTVRLHA